MKSPNETIQEQIESERLLEDTLRRMNARVLGVTLGGFCATGLFLATVVLVVRGGQNVGHHLGLLHYYFPYYEVSYLGSVIGACWAFLFGFIAGNVISLVYNFVADLRGRTAPKSGV